MPKMPVSKKEKLKELIMKGQSINKISEELSIAKSTIYYTYKKLKGKKFILPFFKLEKNEIEGEIVGIFAGDGSQYFHKRTGHYEVNVHFGVKSKEYALYVQQLYESFFNHSFRLREEKNGRILRLKIESKIVYGYFKNYLDYEPRIKHCTVKLNSLNYPLAFKIGFIRGLIDTDGSVLYKKDRRYPRVSFSTTSKNLASQVCLLLKELDVGYGYVVLDKSLRNEKNIELIYILAKDTDKFLNIVKPFKLKNLRARGESVSRPFGY
jgi:hypothetical protein